MQNDKTIQGLVDSIQLHFVNRNLPAPDGYELYKAISQQLMIFSRIHTIDKRMFDHADIKGRKEILLQTQESLLSQLGQGMGNFTSFTTKETISKEEFGGGWPVIEQKCVAYILPVKI